MNDDNLLKEVQEDYKNAQKPKRKARKTKEQAELERIDRIRAVKRKVFMALMLIVLSMTGVAYAAERYVDWRAEHQWQFPLVWVGLVRKVRQEVLSPVVNVEASAEVKEEAEKEFWTGKVSFYSSGEGCLGCSANEIMANGEKFDENAMTLAFNRLPLNTRVRVTNLDNGANTVATVTDTGGFEAYGRIADLSKGLMTELNAFTDVSSIKIEVL